MKIFGFRILKEKRYKEMEETITELNSDWNIAFNVMARQLEALEKKEA